jgi:hypothetical protein
MDLRGHVTERGSLAPELYGSERGPIDAQV